ncbi:MAG: hypothetical protein HY719_01715 [Planctomycetes bacterium]|nr:hypothetical protein [Planctomycetota bacterium]
MASPNETGADGGRARLWPEPYRAAFAICSDADDSTWERFDLVQRLLRTREPTPFGPGLGWEGFADTFFGFTRYPAARTLGQVSVFADEEARVLSPHAGEIAAAIRRGAVDGLHGWGDCIAVGGFRRGHAEAILAWMRREGLAAPVWVNHGDRHNVQNLGAVMGRGDDPARAEVYNADLVRQAGCRWHWLGDLSRVPGQGVDHPLGERLTPISPVTPAGRRRGLALALARLYEMTGASPFLKGVHRLGWQFERRTPLLTRARLRDGSEVWVFTRYGAWDAADFATLPAVVNDDTLAALVRSGGAMILYTHLGRRPPTEAGVAALRQVDKLFREGALWVTGVPALLARYAHAKGFT